MSESQTKIEDDADTIVAIDCELENFEKIKRTTQIARVKCVDAFALR